MGLLPDFYASHLTSLMPTPFVPAFDQAQEQARPHLECLRLCSLNLCQCNCGAFL